MPVLYKKSLSAAFLVTLYLAFNIGAIAQSGVSSTSVVGSVVDPTGAVVPNATVEIHNPVSGFSRNTITDSSGKFSIPNVPFNPYHVSVTGQGFAPYAQDIDVRSVVPVNVSVTLQVKGSSDQELEIRALERRIAWLKRDITETETKLKALKAKKGP